MASFSDTPQSELDPFRQQRRRSALGFFIVGALLALFASWLGVRYRAEYVTVVFGSGFLALVMMAAGLYQMARRPGSIPEAETNRLLILAIAGLSGLTITLMGLALAYQWWDVYLSWMNADQGKEGWKMWVSVLIFLGGLALMFAGLQIARTEERSNPVLRRLLYGYNALLAAVLLLAVLAVANVIVFIKFQTPIDFTASSLYTLSSQSKNILRGLDQPTKIYVMLPGGLYQQEAQTLLTNCRDINDKIEVKYLSPDLDDEEVRGLEQKYSFTNRDGILVVYGTDQKEFHQFITFEDLFTFDNVRSKDMKFKGEDALMTTLSYLSEGKTKPVLYFTQGHGELDLSNLDANRPDQGSGDLKNRLEKRNFDVKPLEFSPANPSIPDNAAVIVVARPGEPFAKPIIQALREYMSPSDPNKKKGKLLVLFDVLLGPDDKMRQTGLEPLMAEFNVQVGNERILALEGSQGNPLQVLAVVNPALLDKNPIATTFQRRVISFYDVRPVMPLNNPEGMTPNSREYVAEPLFLVPAGIGIWKESNLSAQPVQIANDLLKNQQELEKKLSTKPISIAVAVTQRSPPSDPHSMMGQPGEGTPRLVVFGDSSIASNFYTQERRGKIQYEIVANCLDWLRERPSNIGIEPKNRNLFVLDRANIDLGRMILLPAALMFLAILGLGASVWAVRRK